MKFLDTNILVRYLLQDVPEQSEFIKNLFSQALSANEELLVLPQVLVELNYVLLNYYQIEKEIVAKLIYEIMAIGFIRISKNSVDFQKALIFYQKYSLSIEDCFYLQCCLENQYTLVSFDKKLVSVYKKCL